MCGLLVHFGYKEIYFVCFMEGECLRCFVANSKNLTSAFKTPRTNFVANSKNLTSAFKTPRTNFVANSKNLTSAFKTPRTNFVANSKNLKGGVCK
jgi:hypothetical protein